MSAPPQYRQVQLQQLIEALEAFIPLVIKNGPQLDSVLPDFDYCLRFAKHLQQHGFTQSDLDELSRNVMNDIFYRHSKGCWDFSHAVESKEFHHWKKAVQTCADDIRLREAKHSGLN